MDLPQDNQPPVGGADGDFAPGEGPIGELYWLLQELDGNDAASTSKVSKVRDFLKEWHQTPTWPTKAVFYLEHKPANEEFSFQVLKNKDKAMVQALQVGTDLGFELYLGLVECVVLGFQNKNDAEPTILRGYYKLKALVTLDGQKEDGSTIAMNRNDNYPYSPWIGKKPDFKTANPDSLDRELHYHFAVAIIWPKNRSHELIFQHGPDFAIMYLDMMMAECDPQSSRNSPEWIATKAAAESIIRLFKYTPIERASLLQPLIILGDKDVLNEYMENMTTFRLETQDPSRYDRTFFNLLSGVIKLIGWDPVLSYLDALSDNVYNYFVINVVNDLDPEWSELSAHLQDRIALIFEKQLEKSPDDLPTDRNLSNPEVLAKLQKRFKPCLFHLITYFLDGFPTDALRNYDIE